MIDPEMTASSTDAALRFSRTAILAAIDVLNRLNHAQLTRFLLELGPDVASQVGDEGSVAKRLNDLIRYIDSYPDHRLEDGTTIQEAVVHRAVQLFPEEYPWSDLAPDHAAFRRALTRDNFTVSHRVLRRTLPAEIQLHEAETEIERLLSTYDLEIAKGHLNQARDSHARGNWAAANSQIRTFLEAILDELAERIDPGAAVLSGGHIRRERLAQLGFLSTPLNEWNGDGKGFINGLIRRLHPEGSHPGLSHEEDCTFRLHIVMVTARLLLTRFERMNFPHHA